MFFSLDCFGGTIFFHLVSEVAEAGTERDDKFNSDTADAEETVNEEDV